MGIVIENYEMAFTTAQVKVFEAAARLRGATVRELFEGALGILGDDGALLEDVLDDGLGPVEQSDVAAKQSITASA